MEKKAGSSGSEGEQKEIKGKKRFVFDSNIVIFLWEKHPDILTKLENNDKVQYKILKEIAGELSPREYSLYNKEPVLSERFIKLLSHVEETEVTNDLNYFDKSFEIKSMYGGNLYYVKENKLSKNDFSLICYCIKNKEYILVTDDKKLLNSARYILGEAKALNYQEFISEIYQDI